MSFDQNANRSKQRMVLLLVGVVGLAAAAILFLIYDSVKKPGQLAATPAPAAIQAAAPSQAVPATDVTVVDASTLLPEQQEAAPAAAPKNTKKNSRSSRRKQVAMRFPAPPVGETHNPDWLNGPKSEVEMWAGDRRSVIWVPPAPKTTEHEASSHHQSHETFY